MAKTQERDQPKDMEKQQRDMLNDIIGEQVIHALGKPVDLLRMQVRLVWDNHYRVNVLVGADAGSVRVANSFFLVVDNEGTLLTANPCITKQY